MKKCDECDRLQVTEDAQFCPLHLAAPRMLALLKEIAYSAEKVRRATPDSESDCFVATPLIRKAEDLVWKVENSA